MNRKKSYTINFITIILVFNIAFADIPKDKIYNYLKISAGGAFFSSYHFNTIVKLAREGFDKESLKKIANDEKYIEVYTDKFLKLSDVDYHQIMTFYKTEVGKKYTQAIFNLAKIEKDNYTLLYEKDKCSHEKQVIINNINKKLNTLEHKLNFIKKYQFEINLINNLKKSIYKQEINKFNNKSKLLQREKILSCLLYKDFTIKELQYIYDYVSTNAGQYENQLFYEGFDSYIRVFFDDIKTLKGYGEHTRTKLPKR